MQSPSEFHEWLERQPATRTYGTGCGNCPVATFMREAKGALWPIVSSYDYGDGAGNDTMPLPAWAQRFTKRWDDDLGPGERSTADALELIKPIIGIKRTM